MLLKPVQEKVKEALETQIYQVQTKGKEMREKVAEYVCTAHQDISDQLDLVGITQQIDKVVISVNQAPSIDSAIARQIELDNMYSELLQQVDCQATKIIQHLTPPDPTNDAVPQVKPIVPVRVLKLAPKTLIETSQDIEDYLDTLRQTLMAEIAQNKRVRLE
jgi:hypothetical protein